MSTQTFGCSRRKRKYQAEAQKPSLTDVNTSTIILVANVMIYPTETSLRDMAFNEAV